MYTGTELRHNLCEYLPSICDLQSEYVRKSRYVLPHMSEDLRRRYVLTTCIRLALWHAIGIASKWRNGRRCRIAISARQRFKLHSKLRDVCVNQPRSRLP